MACALLIIKNFLIYMEVEMGNFLLTITVDFATSHWYFPKIIIGILIILGIGMAIVHLPRKIKAVKSEHKVGFFVENYDKVKLYGSIALIAAYFKAMEIVGAMFPNMGYGFLFCSIVFIFVASVLFLRKPTKRQWIVLIVNSIVTPVFVWYVFGVLFFISLP